ncbi:MAG: DoxX family protein [Muribaculaceae bacterium]
MLLKVAKSIFVYMSTHSYSNLSRLFLRLFVGVMLLQLGVNQMSQFDELSNFSGFMGMSGSTAVAAVIVVELVCSMLIVLGLFTRLAILPLLVIMGVAAGALFSGEVMQADMIYGMMPEMLPMLFCGVLVFFGISGPGKISLDYILARYTVSCDASSIEEEKTLDEA